MSTSARRLRIPHPNLFESQRTFLDADYSTGTNLSVQSNVAFAIDQIAVIGNPGEEQTEAKDIDGLSGNQILQLSAILKYDHNSGTPIFRSEYDQIEISANTGSGWSVLTTIDIQWDQLYSIYVHQGGTDSYSYRFRFYNSASANYSEYSGTLTGAGYTKDQLGYWVDFVRKVVGDYQKRVVQDEEILRFFTLAKDIIRAKAPKGGWYFWKRRSEGTITTTASVAKYNLDTISDYVDFIAQIRYRYNDGSEIEIYPLEPKTDLEFYDLVRDPDRQDDDWVDCYRLIEADSSSDSGYIEVYPTPKTTNYGSFYIDWYINEADFTSFSDTTDIPIPQILADFVISKIEEIKGNDGKAKVYRDLFYGPANDQRDNDNLTGISLLYSLQDKKLKALRKPQQLKHYRGPNFMGRMYSTRSISKSMSDREYYW